MARLPLSRMSVGAFTAVLSFVLLLMVGGLVATDQALGRAGAMQARADAAQAALSVQQGVAGLYERLSEEALSWGGLPKTEALVHATTSLSAAAPGLERITVFDSANHPIADTIVAEDNPASPLTANPLAGKTRGKVMVSRVAPNDYDVVIARVIPDSAHIDGVIVASYSAEPLFRSLLTRARSEHAGFAIITGTDTVVAGPTPVGRATTNRLSVVMPGGAQWTIIYAHEHGVQRLRLALFGLAILTITLLGVTVIRERRQAIAIRERSAQLEQLYSEVARANTAKTEFLANVSHELRTPLNAIVGFVELLKDGVYGELSSRQEPPVDRIAASANHLRHLVDQVLDIAKIAAGRLEVHPETVTLRPFVLNVASELESLVNERGLSFSIAVGASLPRVRTDPAHLRQILVNLIGNAVKYTLAGGIAVRARLIAAPMQTVPDRISTPVSDPVLAARSPDPTSSWVALQVTDSGIGIAPGDQERIFDEFEQVDAGPRGDSMQRGTGLGLAISRRLARLLGGDISVESQLGKGSTFTLWLPVAPGDLAAANPERPAAAAAS